MGFSRQEYWSGVPLPSPPSCQSYGFSSSHVWMWDLDYKEIWVPKNWCFWTVVLEKTLENPLDCKEIQPVNPKGNQPWIFIGRTDAEAETPVLWPPDVKNWLIWKDPDAGKDWRQEEKGSTEMVEWDHWFDGHEFEQVLGAGDGQASLACCRPWGRRVRHDCVTELKNSRGWWRHTLSPILHSWASDQRMYFSLLFFLWSVLLWEKRDCTILWFAWYCCSIIISNKLNT